MKTRTELYAGYTIWADIDYKLEANIDYNKNNSFYMPSLTFLKVKSKEYSDQEVCWDNDEYLLLLHSALRKYEDLEKFTDEEKECLKDLSDTIDNLREDFPVILELLEKGIEIGMFKDTLK